MKITLVQAELTIGQVETNYQEINQMIQESLKENPDVIVLPEMWNTSFFPDNVLDLADPAGEKSRNFLRQVAKKHKVNIVGGSISRSVGGKVYNSSYIYNRQGEEIAHYDKAHAFSPSGEDQVFEPGNKRVHFQLDGVDCGIITCYDLRFPEWVRAYALEGIDVLFVPAAWPEARIDHWDILNQARAIENQIFLVATNSVGHSSEGNFGGNSTIINPWGHYLVEPSKRKGVFTGTIDLSQVSEIREKIGIYKDRRPDIY